MQLGVRKEMHYVCSYSHRKISQISVAIVILSWVLDAAEGLSHFGYTML